MAKKNAESSFFALIYLSVIRMRVEKNQEKFFDQYATAHGSKKAVFSFFGQLADEEIYKGLKWLSGCKNILDYGCGVGEGITQYRDTTNDFTTKIVGIDLSEVSIGIAKKSHPMDEFHVVKNNDLSFRPPDALGGAYMIGVLHHSEHHQKIFDEVSRVLEPGGKFFIFDLTKNNPLIEMPRALFPYMPKRIKRMFPDDLVTDDTIPEKLTVEVDTTISALRKAGFIIESIEYGHLFFFLFDWFERMTGLQISTTRFKAVYLWFYKLEKKLLQLQVFKERAHIFAIHAVKDRPT